MFTPELAFWVGSFLFCATYIVIVFDKFFRIDKTVAALVGGSLMLLTVFPKEAELAANNDSQLKSSGTFSLSVDFDVIFLLIGMMVIVNYLRKTGLFQYVAIKCAKIGKGYPHRVMILLVLATALLSALLDNVTTVLLMAPVTLLVANELKVNPIPFLMAEIMVSSLGGTATLIGDPPNVMIGSAADLSFMDFIKVAMPLSAILVFFF